MDRALFLKPTFLLVALATSLALLPASQAGAATVTIDGSPLDVYAGDAGNIQAKLDTDANRVFFPPGNELGDAGLFLGFPASPLTGAVFGPPSSGAQTAASAYYTPDSQGSVTGTGTAADPFQVVTAYKVRTGGVDYFVVTQTVKYVQGEKKFRVGYTIQNVTSLTPPTPPGTSIRFRASSGADLYIEGSDYGTGLLDSGPPRFLAGVNHSVGRAGGMLEVPGSSWDAYEVANYLDVWSAIHSPIGPGLDNSLVEDVTDNGAAVQWNGYYGVGQDLAPGASVTYEVDWRFAAIVPLSLSPKEGTQSANKTYKISATATEVTGNPMVGKNLRYSVTGANPGSGTATAATDASGQAEIAYVGKNVGADTVTVYIDLNDSGARDSNEPQVEAKVTWTEYKPPPPPVSASIVVRGPYVVSKDGKVEVFLTCPASAPAESGCEGDLTGRLSVRKHGPHKNKSKKHKKAGKKSAEAAKKKKKKKYKPFKPGTRKYSIGPAHYKLDPKQNSAVKVAVNPQALKRLKKMKRAIVSFTVRTTGKTPQSAIGTIRLAR